MSTSARPQRVAVVGAGWAGLAAAVEATRRGHQVSLFDMATSPGGRARSHPHGDWLLDNGQHILIGAYRDTLALMRLVGAPPEQLLMRRPLALVTPDGQGLRLPGGPPALAFVRGVLAWQALSWRDRLQLLQLAGRWRLAGFRCAPALSVAELAGACPPAVFEALLDPLCVAALNTPAQQASAQVFLTVLRDALFGGPGAADLLLPRAPLNRLLPEPAVAWLAAQGARWLPGRRVHALQPQAHGWQVGEEHFDHVVLACSANESARLLAPHAPAWAATASGLHYQPIVTVWLQASQVAWPEPMLSFVPRDDQPCPAQFGFDLGALGGPAGIFSMVVSGAADWVARGLPATAEAVRQQWLTAFGRSSDVQVVTVRADKRATFACTPGLHRPSAHPLPRLSVAGDHVAGPYPATLEGAVRSGLQAVAHLEVTQA